MTPDVMRKLIQTEYQNMFLLLYKSNFFLMMPFGHNKYHVLNYRQMCFCSPLLDFSSFSMSTHAVDCE